MQDVACNSKTEKGNKTHVHEVLWVEHDDLGLLYFQTTWTACHHGGENDFHRYPAG